MRLPRPRGPRWPGRLRGPRSLAGQLFAMQVVLVAVVVVGCAVFAYLSAGRQAAETATRQATAVGAPRAANPPGGAAGPRPDPPARDQPDNQ
ncbi:histidine kinase, partial [Streptomyces lydicus]